MTRSTPPRATGSHADGADLALVQASRRAHAWLFALAAALPLAMIGAAGLADGGEASAGPLPGIAAICMLVWAGLALLARRHRLQLDADGVEIATTFYRRRFAASDLDLARARVVDLDERPEYRPALRTNGMSLPGFHSGWYRLRNGNRALVATAGGKRLLWLPTRSGHDLLLQPGRPEALLERLRTMAAGAARR